MALPAQAWPDDIEIRESVAKVIRMAMRVRGVNQKVLAANVPMSESQLSERLSAKRAFRIDELAHVARALDVEIATFFKDLSS